VFLSIRRSSQGPSAPCVKTQGGLVLIKAFTADCLSFISWVTSITGKLHSRVFVYNFIKASRNWSGRRLKLANLISNTNGKLSVIITANKTQKACVKKSIRLQLETIAILYFN